jgi:hypothetical protein
VSVNDFTVSNMNPQEAILITDRIRLELINTGVFRAARGVRNTGRRLEPTD